MDNTTKYLRTISSLLDSLKLLEDLKLNLQSMNLLFGLSKTFCSVLKEILNILPKFCIEMFENIY